MKPQCEHIKPDGKQCSRKATISDRGTHLCGQHYSQRRIAEVTAAPSPRRRTKKDEQLMRDLERALLAELTQTVEEDDGDEGDDDRYPSGWNVIDLRPTTVSIQHRDKHWTVTIGYGEQTETIHPDVERVLQPAATQGLKAKDWDWASGTPQQLSDTEGSYLARWCREVLWRVAQGDRRVHEAVLAYYRDPKRIDIERHSDPRHGFGSYTYTYRELAESIAERGYSNTRREFPAQVLTERPQIHVARRAPLLRRLTNLLP